MKSDATIIHVCSPVMDLTTQDVWRAFSATDFPVSEIYDKMFEAGIAIENQRVGSLLNFCATKNIGQIKVLEPDMYARINARFQNIEFMSQFSKSGYYKIGKPRDMHWNGRNHIKAGISMNEVSAISDRYEFFLKKYNIPYKREQHDFTFEQDKENKILKAINPFKDLLEGNIEGVVVEESDRKDIQSLDNIHTTWRDYCLYLLNTTGDPIRGIWREKMITSILSWKMASGSTPDSTIDALQIMSELPSDFVESITDDRWEFEDWKTFGRLNISGKHVLSISHYPQQSLEKECLECIEKIVESEDQDMLQKSPKLMELFDLWNMQGGKSITPLEAQRNFFAVGKSVLNPLTDSEHDGKDNVTFYPLVDSVPDKFSKKYWQNALKAANVWFKEQIHSTSSWKRFAIGILKNDVTLKYLGFAPSLTERLARSQATEAFSQKQSEKEKARKEALKLASQIEKENNQ